MTKKIILLLLTIIISTTPVFANNDSVFGDNSKLSYESKIGFSKESVSLQMENSSAFYKTQIVQNSVSLSQTIKYDSENEYNYVLSGVFRIPAYSYYITSRYPTKKYPMKEDSFQKSINLFFGVDKEFELIDNLSLTLVAGIDGIYFFENESAFYGSFEKETSSYNYSFGYTGAINLDYRVLNKMKLSIGISIIYNPLIYSEISNAYNKIAKGDDFSFSDNFLAINPTIGIVYSL